MCSMLLDTFKYRTQERLGEMMVYYVHTEVYPVKSRVITQGYPLYGLYWDVPLDVQGVVFDLNVLNAKNQEKVHYKLTAKRITKLKKFHVKALNLTFKIHITLNSYSIE